MDIPHLAGHVRGLSATDNASHGDIGAVGERSRSRSRSRTSRLAQLRTLPERSSSSEESRTLSGGEAGEQRSQRRGCLFLFSTAAGRAGESNDGEEQQALNSVPRLKSEGLIKNDPFHWVVVAS